MSGIAQNKNVRVIIDKKNRHIYHWIIVAGFFMSFSTGLIIFTPALGWLASDSWTRIIHRAGAVILLVTPIIYSLANRKAALVWLKEALFWRGRTRQSTVILDTWRWLHKSLVLVGYVLFALTGAVMWFFKETAPGSLLQWTMVFHGIIFILAADVLLVHIFFEFDWWLWKRKHCRECTDFSCIEVCPKRAIARTSDDVVEYYPDRCDSCGLCKQKCR